MPGTLYIVATPIGNLEDVTLRALRILREVALIAAEDTRRTARLLQQYSISTPTTSLHQHNEHKRTSSLLARLEAGESIALVTDAGTPVVSDPGAHVVAAAHAAGIRVEPIPGPSAVMAALSASGFEGDQFLFVGFPPSRAKAREAWLRGLESESRTMVLYEAPHRIEATLKAILAVLGDRHLALGRELTKAHEELAVRPISRHIEALKEPRGEYTLVLEGASTRERSHVPAPTDEVLQREFGQLTMSGVRTSREAVKLLAKKYALPARSVYAVIHRDGNSVE